MEPPQPSPGPVPHPAMQPRREPPVHETLEISEDIEFEKRSWRWERVGQAAVLLLLLAALAGLFGGGPLSTAQAVSPTGVLTVEYPRFVRNQSAYELRIQVASAAVRDGHVDLWINGRLAEAITVNSISPTPDAAELGADRHVWRFRAVAAGPLATIIVHATADAIGREQGELGLVGGEQVALTSFIYP